MRRKHPDLHGLIKRGPFSRMVTSVRNRLGICSKFEPDIAAADDHQMLRQRIELKYSEALVRYVDLIDAGHIRNVGVRPALMKMRGAVKISPPMSISCGLVNRA